MVILELIHAPKPDVAEGLCLLDTELNQVPNLVDPASSQMLVSKIKPCISLYKLPYDEAASGSLKRL